MIEMKNKNLVWFDTGVTNKDRKKQNGHKALLLWLTGLSCAGKSTIAKGLNVELFRRGCQVYVLDGDNIRHGLNCDLGFSPENRKENIRRIGEVAKLFVDAGFIIITAFISPYREDREKARSIFEVGKFLEVYVKADVSECEKRDVKGLYKKAREGTIGEFTGVSAPYEAPETPELIVDTQMQTVEESVGQIIKYLKEKEIILR
jgi:adenylyl-sulfate kinase